MKDHPYSQYIGTKAWKVLDKAIMDLVHNQDLDEKTKHEYIVGYILQSFKKKSLL